MVNEEHMTFTDEKEPFKYSPKAMNWTTRMLLNGCSHEQEISMKKKVIEAPKNKNEKIQFARHC